MTATPPQLHGRGQTATRRLLVTVQDPETKAYRPVGFLRYDGDQYTFAYLRREREREGFRPLPGLARAADGPLRSATLFPLFAERVISSRRPDRELSMDALGLPLDAEPMEVLARSHGQRVGDLMASAISPKPSKIGSAHCALATNCCYAETLKTRSIGGPTWSLTWRTPGSAGCRIP